MSPPRASVVICTHNPRTDYLTRVLNALKAQTLAFDQWELLLIDNASAEPIAPRFDLSWHPNARHVREDELGLTPARLRGIKEAAGEVLVFVDDDNVLDSDYLEQSLKIVAKYPFLGAWGGSVVPEFEMNPEDSMRRWGSFWGRNFASATWGNDRANWGDTMPYGAGLCIRSNIACLYAKAVTCDPLRLKLGRRGSSLSSSEDLDLVLACSAMHLGWGNFPALKLTHLIASHRLTESYHLKLIKGISYSNYILSTIQNLPKKIIYNKFDRYIRFLYLYIRRGRFQALQFYAVQNGRLEAFQIIEPIKLELK